MNEKVKLIRCIDKYEKNLCNAKNKSKKDYIGQTGKIIKTTKHHSGAICDNLCDVKFSDGQVWCCEMRQLEFIS